MSLVCSCHVAGPRLHPNQCGGPPCFNVQCEFLPAPCLDALKYVVLHFFQSSGNIFPKPNGGQHHGFASGLGGHCQLSAALSAPDKRVAVKLRSHARHTAGTIKLTQLQMTTQAWRRSAALSHRRSQFTCWVLANRLSFMGMATEASRSGSGRMGS